MTKKEQVLTNFRDLFSKMVWLNKLKLESALNDYKPSEVHCIEYIGNHTDANVTKMAESMYMTRGAISKITKKLIDKQLIESYQKADNKKEIYFKLTEKGLQIQQVHDQLHQEFEERDQVVFEQVTDEQFDRMLHFIERYSNHLDDEIKKLDHDPKPE